MMEFPFHLLPRNKSHLIRNGKHCGPIQLLNYNIFFSQQKGYKTSMDVADR
jgi:hypothetical protein